MIQKLFIIDFYNADVFCSFSDSDNVSDDIKELVKKILKPKYIEWIKTDNPYNITHKITFNSYLMFKKIYLCNQYKLKYELINNFKYDLVIRIRPDICIFTKIPQIDFSKNILYLPEYKSKSVTYISAIFSKTPDNIALSNSYVMDRYSDAYKYFILKISSSPIILPEVMLKEYLIENKIRFEKIIYPWILYRYSFDLSNLKNINDIKSIIISKVFEYIKYHH